MFKYLFVSFMLMFSCSQLAAADGDVTGKIVRLSVQNGIAYIKTEPRPPVKPGCASNPSWDYAFSIIDETGKATLSLSLSAYASKATVQVKAKFNCTLIGNMDDVNYLILE